MFFKISLLFFSVYLCRLRVNSVIDDNHFVVASPWCGYSCNVRIYNMGLRHVWISILQVSDDKHLTPVRIEKTGQYEMKCVCDTPTSFISHKSRKTLVVTSTGRIEVFVHSFDSLFSTSLTKFNPKSYCYQTYYTITVIQTPFITVIAFDFTSTNVVIDIPKYKDEYKFNKPCNATANCEPEASVNVTLNKYEFWYFYLHPIKRSLNHVKITADRPVNVVSGNIEGILGESFSSDRCVTSLKPQVTWGKNYVIPGFLHDPKAFVVSTTDYPLTVTFHGPNGHSQTYTVTSPLDDPYTITDNRSETLAVTADIPFALYQFFYPSKGNNVGDTGILNLIPTEQWKHGAFYVCHNFSNFIVRSYLISQATPDEIKMEIDGNTDVKPVMEDSLLRFDNKEYYIAYITECESAKIYSTNPTKKMMIYTLLLLPPGHPTKAAMGSMPHSYYQGNIYQPDCQISDQLYLQDGVDNDCDGRIDEEVENGIDDDGDGLIDEDSVEIYSDGEWSEWTRTCNQPCSNGSMSVRTRMCGSRSTFGKYCQGPSIQCDKSTCPQTCGIFNRSETDCVCDSECLTCRYSIFECDRCKPGYMPTLYCKTPCPKGRGGLGCRKIRRDEDERKKSSIDLLLLYILIISLLILTAVITGCWLLGKSESENKEEENEEEEDKKEFEAPIGQEEAGWETLEGSLEEQSIGGQSSSVLTMPSQTPDLSENVLER